MSSILKALRKLEEEKADLRRDPLKIDAEILSDSHNSSAAPIRIFLASICLFLCGGAVMYFLLSKHQEKLSDPLQDTSRPQTVSSENKRYGVNPEKEEVAKDKISANSEAKPFDAPPEKPFPITHHRPQPSSDAYNQPPPQPVVISRKKPDKAPQEKVEQINPATPAQEPPLLRVDGIAFQEGAEVFAVVNGVSVSKGSVINGIKVEEVQKDRVLFSYNGKRIEVSMGKSNR